MHRFLEVSEFLKSQDIDYSPQDLEELELFLWQNQQHRKAESLANGIIPGQEIEADIGKAIGFVAGAALGALFLPGLGVVAGWAAGALVGGAIGTKLVSLFDAPQQKITAETGASNKTANSDPIFRFSGSGELGTLGSIISVIYCNRTKNPDGGVYLVSAPLIRSNVYSNGGDQIIDLSYLLGVGKLGFINYDGTLINDQNRSQFRTGDIVSSNTLGWENKESVAIAPNYSQMVAISTNNLVGTENALVTAIDPKIANLAATFSSPINGTVVANIFKKTLATTTWDASCKISPAVMTLPNGYGAYLSVAAKGYAGGASFAYIFVGFAVSSAATNHAQMDIALSIGPFSTDIHHLGVLLFSFPTPGSGTGLSPEGIEIELRVYSSHPNQQAQAFRDGVEIWRGAFNPSVFTTAFFATGGCYYAGNELRFPTTIQQAPPALTISPGIGSRFSVSQDNLPLFKSSKVYRLGNGNANDIFVVNKSSVDAWIELSDNFWLADRLVPLSTVSNPTPNSLMAYYKATFSTSKKVDAVDILLEASTWARDVNGDLVSHGQAFQLLVVINGAEYLLGRFLIYGKTLSITLHTITINGLNSQICSFVVKPLSNEQILVLPVATTFYRLIDSPSTSTFYPPTPILSLPINITTEIADSVSRDFAANAVAQGNKPRKSSDDGPTLRVTHINEKVFSLTPITYPGYTIASVKLLASDRLQSVPEISWEISLGQIIRNHLWAGLASSLGAVNAVNGYTLYPALPVGTVIDMLGVGVVVITTATAEGATTAITEKYTGNITTVSGFNTIVVADLTVFNNLLPYMPIAAAGIPINAVILEKQPGNKLLIGTEWGIATPATASATVAATFNNHLPKTDKAELVIYQWDSSNYFPDLYVDRLINPISGLGALIDKNEFIDYSSIVYSRKFCVKNNFFFDGILGDGSFEDWAVSTAPSSLLFVTRIEGKYALIPQEDNKPDYLFNASNTIRYSESGVPWQQERTNTVLVRYQTNQGRERQLKIQTTAANLGTEPEITSTISTQGVTSIAQATKVGQVALKSLRLQSRACQIETDVAIGFYTRQGKIVRTQHTIIEYGNEVSGFVTVVEAVTNPRFLAVKTIGIQVVAGGIIKLAQPHQIKPLSANATLTADTVTIAGSTAVNGTYAATTIQVIDEWTILVTGAGNGVGGTLTVNRTVYDQVVQLSDMPVITANSRVTFAHRTTRVVDIDKVITLLTTGRYQIIAVESALAVGDAYAIGEAVIFNRVWRITSVSPDVKQNTVTLTGITWNPDIMSPSGLVTI